MLRCVVCQRVSEAADDVTSPCDDVTCDVNRLNDDVLLLVFMMLSLRDRMRCHRGEMTLSTRYTALLIVLLLLLFFIFILFFLL